MRRVFLIGYAFVIITILVLFKMLSFLTSFYDGN
jgi:hypothetical protein